MDNDDVKGSVQIKVAGDVLSITVTGDTDFLDASFTDEFLDALRATLATQGFPDALDD